MASVWVARDRSNSDRIVAVKAILPELAQDLEFRSMFLDEGRIAGSIDHENVVSIHDVAEDKGVLYMAMEWVEGDSLRTVIKEARSRKPVPADIGARVIADAARGLHAAHELTALDGKLRHLVHCDVSPHNILIGLQGAVKIVDFGVASAVGHVNGSGGVRGKFGYMSPEQARGERVDRRSDLFSLAIVLYELTVGKRLFRGSGPQETLQLVREGEIPAPREIIAGYPERLEQIVLRGLERDVTRRYQSARDFQEALEQFLTATGTVVPRAGVAGLLKRVLRDSLIGRRHLIRSAAAELDGALTDETTSTAPAVALELDHRTAATHTLQSSPSWTASTPHGAAVLPPPRMPPEAETGRKPPTRRHGAHRLATAGAIGLTIAAAVVIGVAASTSVQEPAGGSSVALASSPARTDEASVFQRTGGTVPELDAEPAPVAVTLDHLPVAPRKPWRKAKQGPGRTDLEVTDLAAADLELTDLAKASTKAPYLFSDDDVPEIYLTANPETEPAADPGSPPSPNAEPRPPARVPSKLDPAIAMGRLGLPSLNRGAALAALANASVTASRCTFPDSPTGEGRVQVTFDPSGTVVGVRVPAPFEGTQSGPCIQRAFRSARIPAFNGAPVVLKRRFRIRDAR